MEYFNKTIYIFWKCKLTRASVYKFDKDRFIGWVNKNTIEITTGSRWQTLSHNVVSSTPQHGRELPPRFIHLFNFRSRHQICPLFQKKVAGIAYPSGCSRPVFSGVRVTRSLVFCVMFCKWFCTFCFGHCVVCPLIYGF